MNNLRISLLLSCMCSQGGKKIKNISYCNLCNISKYFHYYIWTKCSMHFVMFYRNKATREICFFYLVLRDKVCKPTGTRTMVFHAQYADKTSHHVWLCMIQLFCIVCNSFAKVYAQSEFYLNAHKRTYEHTYIHSTIKRTVIGFFGFSSDCLHYHTHS